MPTDTLELSISWQRHLGPTTSMEPVLNRYREAHRHYHGVGHLRWVLRHVEDLARTEAVTDLGAVVAAAWFHDAVYTGAPDGADEAASARVANETLTALGWNTERREHVAAMVRATAGHVQRTPGTRTDATEIDTAVLLDADLAVLAADAGGYATYVRGVRTEYGHLEDAAWRDGRTAVLRTLQSRDPLFLTVTARTRWEHRAHANIAAELASLSAPDPAG